MYPVDSGRIVRSYTQLIVAPPEVVFPLLCPVREADWLAGWASQVEIVHSDLGFAEVGCVFKTQPAGQPETVWIITQHDPLKRTVEFWRVTTGRLATRLLIEVEPSTEGKSLVRITYQFTPLNQEGRAFIKETHSEHAFREDMSFWEASMNHWLLNGTMLSPSGAIRTEGPAAEAASYRA